MAINNINIGATPNDGTGDAIRSAFDIVNENFAFVQGGLFAGTESSIISALSVTGGTILANTSVTANLTTSNNLVVTGQAGGNLFVQSNGATIIGNVSIIGNLTVSGSQAASQSQASSASLLNLHYSATPLILNDSKDIGLVWQYYTGGPEKKGFLGWQNSTSSLIYWDDITESAGNVITAGTPGNLQIGSLLLANTTSSTSNITGALQLQGGAGILGNVNIQSNIFVGNNANVANLTVRGFHVGDLYFAGGNTIYINGSPVQTAAQAFNGGTVSLTTIFNDTAQATSAVSGAVQVRSGLGVAGNIWAGNIHANIAGNVRANVIGNIFTASQPYITSLGQLTALTVEGQTTARDIIPSASLTYQLGSSGSTRWSKIWTFDLDMSGTLTGGQVNSTGGSHTGNIAINTTTIAGLTTTTAIAELFPTNASTIRIGGAGQVQFRSNTQATNTSSGAVVVTGGMSITTGNLYISGSAGTSIVADGIIDINSNIQATSTTSGALQVQGGASITQGNLYIGGSGGRAIIVTGNIVPSANVVATNNLGSDTLWWNNFYGVSTQARYADLAEKYVPDAQYKVGTVVVFGGDQEITVTETFADVRVAGVISENPAHLMNAGIDGLPVALRGRVPVQVLGPVSKGDLLVTSTQAGFAQSIGQSNIYTAAVFGKSLVTDGRNGSKIIEAVII